MSNNNENSWQYWDERRHKIFSRRGGWEIGKGVHNFGYDMMKDLAGKKNYFQVLTLNCTGVLPSEAFGNWLGGLFICLSWPDPRIWCNTMGSLAGTVKGSSVSGVCAGLLSTESPMFGGSEVVFHVSNFMYGAVAEIRAGKSVEQLIKDELEKRAHLKKPVIPGFARPLATGDERVASMSDLARELGFPIGEQEALANAINEYLLDTQNESMNIGGYLTAFIGDQGFNPTQIRRLMTTLVNSGIHACYAEEDDNPPLSFMPMACEDIDYRGPEKRKL